MEGYTKFTDIEVEGNVFAGVVRSEQGYSGALLGGATLTEKAADYALSVAERACPYVGVSFSAASMTLTLGLAAGQVMLVHNTGATNACTLKNLAGDTGTALAAGKAALVVGSETVDASVVLVLN